ncbi:hypothetical protein [Lysinibacillus sp. FW12]|uniref:hypothetical protein n=1 Tax=Lysinibacillus sp. FW12 TaxID=3096079 RepID=UPI003D713D03
MGLLGLAGSLLGMIPKVGSPSGKKKGKSGGSKGKSTKKSSKKKSTTKKKQRKSNKKKKKKKRKKKKKKWGKFFTKARKLYKTNSAAKAVIKDIKKPVVKSLNSFKEIGKDFKSGLDKRADKALDSPYDFANYLTLGAVDGIWSGAKGRADKMLDSPSDFFNYATFGFTGMVQGAVNPKDPLSKEHWLDSFGVATSVLGVKGASSTKPTGVSSGKSTSSSSSKVTSKIDHVEETGPQQNKIPSKDVSFKVKSMDPSQIRFSQTSVNGSEAIINSMKANGWKGDPIDVVKMPDGNYTTIDNTRVAAAREVGINVEAIIRDCNEPLPSNMIDRFTTKKGVPETWGEALELRVQKQKASFRNDNPMGSYQLEKMK